MSTFVIWDQGQPGKTWSCFSCSHHLFVSLLSPLSPLCSIVSGVGVGVVSTISRGCLFWQLVERMQQSKDAAEAEADSHKSFCARLYASLCSCCGRNESGEREFDQRIRQVSLTLITFMVVMVITVFLLQALLTRMSLVFPKSFVGH